jgi:NAD(P)-dependent dehydrogenase (short-subunit alcohol dehydrogenase family)
MRVVLADVDEPALEHARDALVAAGHEALSVRGDVSRLEDVEAIARSAEKAFGAVHVLCNNAGVTNHTGQAIWELTDNDWRWLLGVNLWGVIHGIRTFVPRMLEDGREGHVVNTASMAGLVTASGAYGAAKHAVVSLSESLAVDLRNAAAPIGVTCVCPGLVATSIAESNVHRPREWMNETSEDVRHVEYRRAIADKTREKGVAPAVVAERIVDAVREGSFYVFTDPPERTDGPIRARVTAILARTAPEAPPRPG